MLDHLGIADEIFGPYCSNKVGHPAAADENCFTLSRADNVVYNRRRFPGQVGNSGFRMFGPRIPKFTAATLGISKSMLALLLFGLAMEVAPAAAQISYSVQPASINFQTVMVGTSGNLLWVTLTNTGTVPLTVNSLTITPFNVFRLSLGWVPVTVPRTGYAIFGIVFEPNAAQAFSGQLTLNITGEANPVVIPLSGKGATPGGVSTLSTTSLDFGNQTVVGTTSLPQSVTITNTGKGGITVKQVTIGSPFSISGFTGAYILQPKASLTLQVSFSGISTGSFRDQLVIYYNYLPPNSVVLTGTAVAVPPLAITNFPTLPAATQSSAYLATLTATGGLPPLTWNLAVGSNLPLGLTLNPSGTITGTLDPSIGVGSYPFTVQAVDSSSPPNNASLQLTLPVGAPTGANCNNIMVNVAGTSTPIVPLTDLATGTYFGYEGGLYPGGSNQRPASHDADGVALAQSIQPLDVNGNPSPTGLYALVSVGMSDSHIDFVGMMDNANVDPLKNPNLVLVNGAYPGASSPDWLTLSSPGWEVLLNYQLPYANVTPNQVVAAWILSIVGLPKGSFPNDVTRDQADLKTIVQNLQIAFPNIKLAYLSSLYYTGYSNGVAPTAPEPYAYDTGFAVQGLIADQLSGDPALNYNPSLGPVMAPWLSWGSYDWTNGLLARNDGLTTSCQDRQKDGQHPSVSSGQPKEGNQLLNFFETDDTTTPWFLAPGQQVP